MPLHWSVPPICSKSENAARQLDPGLPFPYRLRHVASLVKPCTRREEHASHSKHHLAIGICSMLRASLPRLPSFVHSLLSGNRRRSGRKQAVLCRARLLPGMRNRAPSHAWQRPVRAWRDGRHRLTLLAEGQTVLSPVGQSAWHCQALLPFLLVGQALHAAGGLPVPPTGE
jgi:hypothetical protein